MHHPILPHELGSLCSPPLVHKRRHASGVLLPAQATVEYQVQFVTPDVRGNGTDGRVLLTLVGDKGASDELSLDPDSSRGLERGSTDVIKVQATDVGKLSAIRVKLVSERRAACRKGDDVRCCRH